MSTKVLIVDDKQMMRDSVGATLQRAGYTVIAASDGDSALKMIGKHQPAAVVTDLKMPGMDGLELLGHLLDADPRLPVVLMTAYGSVNDAVSAMKAGAFDFIQKPFEGDQLKVVVRRAVQHRQRAQAPTPAAPAASGQSAVATSSALTAAAAPDLVGDSPAMQAATAQVLRIADSHGTVLIQGESGTGKEVVARTLHANSPRRGGILLCLNCAALSSSLLESELSSGTRRVRSRGPTRSARDASSSPTAARSCSMRSARSAPPSRPSSSASCRRASSSVSARRQRCRSTSASSPPPTAT